MTGIFKGTTFYIGTFQLSIKAALIESINANGGSVVHVLSKTTKFVIVSDVEAQRGTSYAVSSASRYGALVIKGDYIKCCVEQKILLDPTPFLHRNSKQGAASTGDLTTICVSSPTSSLEVTDSLAKLEKSDSCAVDQLASVTPPLGFEGFSHQSVAVLRRWLQKDANGASRCIELHSISSPNPVFRVWSRTCPGNTAAMCRYFHLLVNAEKHYSECIAKALLESFTLPECNTELYDGSPFAFVSDPSGADVELKELLEAVYNDAANHALATVDFKCGITLTKLDEAEKHLAQISAAILAGDTPSSLWVKAYFNAIPRVAGLDAKLDSTEALHREEQLLQIVRDVLSLEEIVGGSTNNLDSTIHRYRALGCTIKPLASDSSEYQQVEKLVCDNNRKGLPFKLRKVYSIRRASEDAAFAFELTPLRLLFHGSPMSNWLGICSRGLLLPRSVTATGVPRTDLGMLGAGLYFASDATTAAKYAKQGKSGKRLMCVTQVALGQTKDYTRVDQALTAAPMGFNSTRGVPTTISDFADEEFVIYSLHQQRLKYIIEFVEEEEAAEIEQEGLAKKEEKKKEKDLHEDADDFAFYEDNPEPDSPDPSLSSLFAGMSADAAKVPPPTIRESSPPSPQEAGLLSSSGDHLPLVSIALRGRIVDCVADVILLQEYFNSGSTMVEVKYVFPLEGTASVYGFEAFIMGKHIVGKCKEKEIARREYNEAITKGHGAYLMEKQENEDVFTVSVGNLPPGEKCVIKVMYVAELSLEGDAVKFSLPASVAPAPGREAMIDRLQETTRTSSVVGAKGIPFDVEISIETLHPIRFMRSSTHRLTLKRTETRAIARLGDSNASLSSLGFEVEIFAENPHEPRLWIEDDDDHRCVMVSFFPSFKHEEQSNSQHTFVLDCSSSMKQCAFPVMKRAMIYSLQQLDDDVFVNIVLFGTIFTSLISKSERARDLKPKIQQLLNGPLVAPTMGGTELGTVLSTLYAYAAAIPDRVHNILLFSDGRVRSLEPILALVQRNLSRARLFCFGASNDVSAHSMQALARWSGGAYIGVDFSSPSLAYASEKRILQQLKRASVPGLTQVNARWGLHEEVLAEAVPLRIVTLFSGDRQIVYAFTRATSAELCGSYAGKQLRAVVQGSENDRLRGKLLHRLAVRAMVAQHESGLYDEDWAKHAAMKESQKASLIKRSLEYGIVTPWTSFVAIEERHENDIRLEQPSFAQLVERETIDDLPYLPWPSDLHSHTQLLGFLARGHQSMLDPHSSSRSIVGEVAREWLAAAAGSLASSGASSEERAAVEKLGEALLALVESTSNTSFAAALEPLVKTTEQLTASLAAQSMKFNERDATRLTIACAEMIKGLASIRAKENDLAKTTDCFNDVQVIVQSIENHLEELSKDASQRSRMDDIRSLLIAARTTLSKKHKAPRKAEFAERLNELTTRVALVKKQHKVTTLDDDGPDKSTLLAWIAQQCAPSPKEIRNFTWHWSDGTALGQLVCSLLPGNRELKARMVELKEKSRLDACATALDAVKTWFGVDSPCTPEDMSMGTNPAAVSALITSLWRRMKSGDALPVVIQQTEQVEATTDAKKERIPDPEWIAVQKKTFLRWANSFLVERMMRADEFEDLADYLPELLEIISSKRIAFERKPVHLFQRLANAEAVLQFLRLEGIKLVSINPEHIADKSPKMLLGLVWTILLRYQIQKASGNADSAKNELLDWIRTRIPDCDVRDFTDAWADGNALRQLIGALDANAVKESSNVGEAAERRLGIPMLVDPSELGKDELSTMTYLSYFRDYEANAGKRRAAALMPSIGSTTKATMTPPVTTPAAPPPPPPKPNVIYADDNVVEEKKPVEPANNDLLEWIRKKIPECNVTNFTSNWSDGRMMRHLVEALRPGSIPIGLLKDGKANLGHAVAEEHLGIPMIIDPSELGKDELNTMTYLSYFKDYEDNEPKRRASEPAARAVSARHTRASGPGLESAVIGRRTRFSIQAVNAAGQNLRSGGEHFSAFVQYYDDSSTMQYLNVEDKQDGTYSVECKLKTLADYRATMRLHVEYKGCPIQNSPWLVRVEPSLFPFRNKPGYYPPGTEVAHNQWLLVVRFEANETPPPPPEDFEIRLRIIRHKLSSDKIIWGAASVRGNAMDVAAMLVNVTSLEACLAEALEDAKQFGCKEIKVVSLRQVSATFFSFRSTLCAAALGLLRRIAASGAVATRRRADLAIPFLPTYSLLSTLYVCDEFLERSRPSNFSLAEWTTIVATYLVVRRLRSEKCAALSDLVVWCRRTIWSWIKNSQTTTSAWSERMEKVLLQLPYCEAQEW